jgi:hypothetical protein
MKTVLTGQTIPSGTTSAPRTSVFVKPSLDNKIGYEVVYDNQRYENGQHVLIDSDRLTIDINATLRDEVTPNPNLGRAMVVGGNKADVTRKNREGLRATLYGNIDFVDFLGS